MGDSSASILGAVLPVLAIIGAGYVLRHRNVVDAAVQHGMMRVVLWLLFPCLVLDRVPHNAALNSGSLPWATLAAGFLSIIAGLLIAWLTAPLFDVREAVARRTFAYCTSIYNYGYVAIPLCQVLVGSDAVAVMLLFNAGIEVGIWTAGWVVLTGRLSKDVWARLLNPMTVGSLFALALNKTGAAVWIPEWLRATFAMLGACAIPLGILMVGMALPALMSGFSWRSHLRASLGACALRNGVIPLGMFAAAALLALPRPLGPILALQAAMPAGIFPIVVAQHFGGDARMALRVAIWSSLCAVFTMPLWLRLLSTWFTGQ
ncbi:MAG: AEC family transporter [Puniceicoccales bacterium]|jgi:predicted permease|nr:AEC family transporter [Puniceicoccales bacterium]